jgi:hypothetical protein
MLIKIKNIIFSWDFVTAFCISVAAYFGLARNVANELCKDIYNVGISVLSIVFSVYFAALAIIISSSDDDFVRFLEEVGDYTRLIATFRYTLALLFGSLFYSIIMYSITAVLINDQRLGQPKFFLSLFTFLFSYSLFAAVSVTIDAIQYAKYRSKFLSIKKKENP